jgi:hypothetical protein
VDRAGVGDLNRPRASHNYVAALWPLLHPPSPLQPSMAPLRPPARHDSIPRCGTSSLLRCSIPRWCPSFCLRRSPAMPRCGHSGRSPWRRWSVGATEGRWGTEGAEISGGGVGGVRGSADGRYIDITGQPISIRYNRPIYKKCAAAGNCNH